VKEERVDGVNTEQKGIILSGWRAGESVWAAGETYLSKCVSFTLLRWEL